MSKKKLLLIIIGIVVVASVTIAFISKSKSTVYEEEIMLTGQGCLVLNYHRVRTSNNIVKTIDKITTLYNKNTEIQLYSVYEDEFEEQITFLKDKGFVFITPEDLYLYINNEKPFPEKCALITFDDVDISVYENAYPILVENNIPFTLFIVTGDVGNPNFKGLQMATWEQIKEMYDSGLATVGGHTHKMHFLEKNKNAPFLNPENMNLFKRDTQLIKGSFEENLGFKPTYYAYPYGFGMPATDEHLMNQGFKMIFSLTPGIVQKDDPAFYIKRLLITRYNWPTVERWAEGL